MPLILSDQLPPPRTHRRVAYDPDNFTIPKKSFVQIATSKIKQSYVSFKSYRFLRIPKLNWLIISFYIAFLVRLMIVFNTIYMKMALTTMIVSNLLLYGLADTLAQSLTMFVKFRPQRGSRAGFRIPFVWEKSKYSSSNSKLVTVDNNNDQHSITARHRGRRIDADDNTSEEEDDLDSITSQDLEELGLTDDSLRLISTPSENNKNFYDNKKNASTLKEEDDDSSKFNFRRLSLFMVWGFIQAFLQYGWYSILNNLYNEDNLFLGTLKRVLTDQLCYSPFSLMAFFAYTTVVMEHGNKQAIIAKLNDAFLQTLVVNYAVWPAVQFINFLLLPKSLQVPFASTVGIFWNAYLSLKNAS